MRKSFLKITLTSCLALALFAGVTRADEAPAPSWTCVPQETVFIVRAPAGNAFIDALRNQTKFGNVVLSKERLDKYTQIFKEGNPDWDQEVDKNLAKYGLKVDDWKDLFAGEVGYAVVLVSHEGKPPTAIGLTWMEPGGDLADRAIKAIQKSVEDNKDPHRPTKRLDSKIDGVDVMQLTTSIMEADRSAEEDDDDAKPADFDKLSPEEQNKWLDARKKTKVAPQLVERDQSHVFIARMGKRVIAANTFPNGPHYAAGAEGAEQKLDLGAETGVEEAKAVFARFLTAHHHNGDPNSNSKAMLATPGLAAALPNGTPMFEIYFDPKPLVKIGQQSKDPMTTKLLTAMGVDKIGPTAVRVAMDKGVVRGSLFSSMPVPRVGIFTLMDQPTLAAQPPEWVSSSVLSYWHVSLDLGKAYTKIREIAVSVAGDAADQQAQMMEQQVQMALKADLPTVLSSLGQRHSVLSYAPKTQDAAQPGQPSVRRPSNAMAIVWQVTNEQIWKTVLQQVGAIAMSQSGPDHSITPVDEQGFTGFRMKNPGFEGGVFLGKSFLVSAFGAGVSESTLAALRTPPAGGDALLTSPLYARSKGLLPMQPGIYYGIVDESRTLKLVRQLVIQNLQIQIDKLAPDDKNRARLDKFKSALPTDEELEGTLGVGISGGNMTDQGLVVQSVVEMPAK